MDAEDRGACKSLCKLKTGEAETPKETYPQSCCFLPILPEYGSARGSNEEIRPNSVMSIAEGDSTARSCRTVVLGR